MSAAEQLILRLISQLRALQNRYSRNTAIYNSLERLIEDVRNNNVNVHEIKSVAYDFEVYPAANLSYFYCPKCHKIYHINSISLEKSSYFLCPSCNVRLVQAYVGIPIPSLSSGSSPLTQPFSQAARTVQPSEYYVAGTDALLGIRCPVHNKLKGLISTNPQRPLQSLRYYCVFNDKNCEYYNKNDGTCSHTGASGTTILIFPPLRGGDRRIIGNTSTDVTKPLSITIFTQTGSNSAEVSTSEKVRSIMSNVIPLVEDVVYGSFQVFDFTVMYLLGVPYSGKLNRIPVIVRDGSKAVFLVRKLDTKGVLLRFSWDAVHELAERIRSQFSLGVVDEFTVIHSISHVLLLALTRLTGLSPNEFGESIFIDSDGRVAELLIYDNSPQGIGGVKAAISSISDYLGWICRFSEPCPRACRTACRACVFYDACPYLNTGLSWRAANLAINRAECPQV